MKKKILFLVIIIFSFFCLTIPCIAAEEKISLHQRDSTLYGLLSQNNNSSLNWESAYINCHIQDVSKDWHLYETENRVQTNYVISNESKTVIQEEFILPFYELDNSDYKSKNTKIEVNEKEIQPQVRHVLGNMGFYYNNQTRLTNTYISTKSFNKNTPVHKVIATADFSLVKEGMELSYYININKSDTSTIVPKNLKALQRTVDDYTLAFTLNHKKPFIELYFIGDIPSYTIQNGGNLAIDETELNLLEFSKLSKPAVISEIDWFNIIAQRLDNNNEIYDFKGLYIWEEAVQLEDIMTVFVFPLSFQPQETIEIDISTPIYLLKYVGTEHKDLYYFTGYMHSEIKNISIRLRGEGDVKDFYGGEKIGQQGDVYTLNGNEFSVVWDMAMVNLIYDAIKMILGGFLTFVVYLIPMIIMFILFLRRKEKKGLQVLYLQKFLSYSLSFFGFLFFVIIDENLSAAIVLLSLFGLLTLTTFIQTVTKKCRDFGRLILETICWVMSIHNLVSNKVFGVFGALWIFNLIDFIFIILKMRKLSLADPTLPKKCLPVGILYELENWIIYFYFAFTLIGAYFWSNALGNLGYIILIFICSLSFYYIGMLLRHKFFFLKPFRKFHKDLDLEDLEKKIQKRQSLLNLHPETINFYNILLAQYSLAHNQEKTKEYIKKCYLPKTQGYVLSYRGMMMRYGQTKDEFEHAYETLKREYYNNKMVLRSFEKFYQFWSPYYGTNRVENISKIYNYQRKNNSFSNAISLFVLIYYYKNENNMSKVEELKNEFLEKYRVLTEFVNDLNNL